MPLLTSLANRKSGLVKKWFDGLLGAYPEAATAFLSHEKDRFRNPIGHTLKESLSALFDGLIQTNEVASLNGILEDVVRIRAIQDMPAGKAVSFPLMLKRIIRAECPAEVSECPDEFANLEARIEECTLLAFEQYVRCREQIFELKYNEAKRSMFLLERNEQNGPLRP